MQKRLFLQTTLITAALTLVGLPMGSAVAAQDTFKVGLILPMTGPFASTGHQVESGVQAYLQQYGTEVAGRKVEVITRDDAGNPADTKRLAQELLVSGKVNVLAGFGLTPLALAVAPIATQTKTPMVIMAAQTLLVINATPYAVRTSGTIPQVTMGTAAWAAKQGIKKVVTLVPDYAPGYESEKAFKEFFVGSGGQIASEIRVPVANPDFAPFLRKVQDLKPDALYVMLPSGPGASFLKEYAARGLAKKGIPLIAHGAVTDDDYLNEAGNETLGIITSDYYSAAHPSAMNKKFVADFKKISNGKRPNFFGVAGYDGMHVIYNAIKNATDANNGDALLAAMKGQSFESPRGPVTLDPNTRDFIQNVYVRKVERVDGQLYNVEFDTIEHVLNTGKTN
ncbi:ABC transporter substrate-binding protein [Eoetvoesiella caeni]|uniref:Branched-chain amino acid transport system substrate-binding protein n=1 Tax=Eoetvoesiella caeni TaxID=645616 RepID=A0A366HH16_9BURK|nr:ABC transporter substrate-binding protein [Eoetvoesiella caeni]MCI2807999.1 ABC transporter substrate-binding protein [Eoetvoesiella caeni]NYT53998.1 ABC transporter substrate-binding protein [Eoetvoesiella caeni]RBP41918.1 branched-chain amino acid transport system substrate-binding protein [Eoetvoesiella caeni]